MDLKNGEKAVRIARYVIEEWVNKEHRPEKNNIENNFGPLPREFKENRGCFVTINTYPDHELRGCIGYPEPVLPLYNALIESAISACNDPRFPPLEKEELDKIVVEVSVLTKPELIKVKEPKEYPKTIRIGRDGLIIERGFRSGLLLPQVATENNLDAKDFLLHLCLKAGLPYTAWLDPDTKIYRFSAEIFCEEKPRGNIVKKEIYK
jgi:hypothetical protein